MTKFRITGIFRLTDEHIKAIRASNEPPWVLARRYGVSRKLIEQLRDHRVTHPSCKWMGRGSGVSFSALPHVTCRSQKKKWGGR